MKDKNCRINIRLNLDKTEQNKAWQYLEGLDGSESRNQFIVRAIVERVEREKQPVCPLTPEECRIVEGCTKQIISFMEGELRQRLLPYVAGLTASTGAIAAERAVQSTEENQPDSDILPDDVDWDFLGG